MERTNVETWVLLRGLIRESGHWDGFDKLLGDRYSASVRLIDLPGAGVRYKELCPFSVDKVIESFRDQLGPKTLKRFFMGLSLGGMVGIRWLQLYPKDFDGAVIINSSVRKFSSPLHRMKIKIILHGLRLMTKSSVEKREAFILEIMSNQTQEKKAEVLKNWIQVQKERPVGLRNTCRQFLLAATHRMDDAAPKSPLLLLRAMGDQIVSPQCSMDIHQKWRSPIFSHPTSGHDLTLDDPEWTLEKISEWRNSQFGQ